MAGRRQEGIAPRNFPAEATGWQQASADGEPGTQLGTSAPEDQQMRCSAPHQLLSPLEDGRGEKPRSRFGKLRAEPSEGLPSAKGKASIPPQLQWYKGFAAEHSWSLLQDEGDTPVTSV